MYIFMDIYCMYVMTGVICTVLQLRETKERMTREP